MGLSKSHEIKLAMATGYGHCYGLNVFVLQNSYAKILIPNVIVLGGEAFGRCLHQE